MNFSLKTSLQCVELTQLLCAINHTTEVLQRRLLVLQIWAQSTIPRRFYSEDYWFSKYGHGQPYHGGFTAKITGSPNMGTVNHTTEVLQRRLLVLQIWARSTMLRKITDPPNMGTVNHATEDLQ